MKAMWSFSENAPSEETMQRIKMRFLCNGGVSYKLTQPFTSTKNDTHIEGCDTLLQMILSLSHQRTLGGSLS